MTEERLKHLPTALRREGHDGPACRVAGYGYMSSMSDNVLVLCGCEEEVQVFWRDLVNAESCWCEKDRAEDRGIVCPRCWSYLASAVDDPPCGTHLCGRKVGHLGPCMTQVIEGCHDDRRLRICLTVPEPPPAPERVPIDVFFERMKQTAKAIAEAGPSTVAAAPAARPRLTIACQGDWEP